MFVRINIFFAFLCSALSCIQAQQAIPSSAGDASGPGGSSSYSVGQVLYNTNVSSIGSLAQGVQQAFEFQTSENIELLISQLETVFYPNPASEYIYISIAGGHMRDRMRYTLFDINGKSVTSNRIASARTRIDLKNIAKGVYLLKLTANNRTLETFKVLKM